MKVIGAAAGIQPSTILSPACCAQHDEYWQRSINKRHATATSITGILTITIPTDAIPTTCLTRAPNTY